MHEVHEDALNAAGEHAAEALEAEEKVCADLSTDIVSGLLGSA